MLNIHSQKAMHLQNKIFTENTIKDFIKRVMLVDKKSHLVTNLQFILNTFTSNSSKAMPVSLLCNLKWQNKAQFFNSLNYLDLYEVSNYHIDLLSFSYSYNNYILAISAGLSKHQLENLFSEQELKEIALFYFQRNITDEASWLKAFSQLLEGDLLIVISKSFHREHCIGSFNTKITNLQSFLDSNWPLPIIYPYSNDSLSPEVLALHSSKELSLELLHPYSVCKLLQSFGSVEFARY